MTYQTVIPAQAGIQQKRTDREADKALALTRCAGLFNQLDSRLRGNDEFRGLWIIWNETGAQT